MSSLLASPLRIFVITCALFAEYNVLAQEVQPTLFFDALLKQTQKRNAVYTLQLSHIGSNIFEGTIFSDQKKLRPSDNGN
jgi:hypothetical protein